jgi:AraC-like DNA-binding protein
MVFPEQAELESLSVPGFSVYTLSLRSDLFDVVAESLELPSLDSLRRGAETVELPHQTMRELRHSARELCMQVQAEPSWLSRSGLQARLSVDLPRQLLLSIAAQRGLEEQAPAHQKGRALRRALDYLAQRSAEVVSVTELCRQVGVSERTLRRAFLEAFGVPPKTYLTTIRLRAARAELQMSRPGEVKISDIANHWGFWHMGQFAADYRRRFGELPSVTLQKA